MIPSKLSRLRAISAALLPLASMALFPLTAAAQGSSLEWFVPGQQRPAAGQNRPPPRPMPPASALPPGLGNDAGATADEPLGPPKQLQVQLPPAPEVPPVAKGPPPPAAIIGILSVPDVLRISVAYQAADRELGARRQRLNEDAQKEQVALRDLGQALVRDRAKMTPEQIRAKEREYEGRVNESRRVFGERNRIIQEAGQYVMAQIERTVEQVAQQVALARGVNLVLNRAQLLGTTTDFDLTPQVAEVLNKVLPTVVIPPEGVSVQSLAPGEGAATPGGITTSSAPSVPLAVPTGAAPAAPAAPLPTPPAAPKPPAKR